MVNQVKYRLLKDTKIFQNKWFFNCSHHSATTVLRNENQRGKLANDLLEIQVKLLNIGDCKGLPNASGMGYLKFEKLLVLASKVW